MLRRVKLPEKGVHHGEGPPLAFPHLRGPLYGRRVIGQEDNSETRGGGDRARTDSFRCAPGRAVYASASIGALGLFAISAAAFNIGGAQESGQAFWLAPAGISLVLAMLGLFWLTRRAPVLLTIGPDGVDLPAAFSRPIAWRDIWRIRLSWRRVVLQPDFILLKLELTNGAQPAYKRRLWTLPPIDGWIAKKYGVRIPVHNLDAPAKVILNSVERFKPVQRVTT